MNKDLTRSLNEFYRARLGVLLKIINKTTDTRGMLLESELISLYHNGINTFYDSLNKSITGTAIKILPGTPPDPSEYNRITRYIEQDLISLYNEIAVLDRFISSNFNSVSVKYNEILQKSKQIASKVGDYLLYADPSLGAGFFFADNFNTLDKVEVNSSLIEEENCFIDSQEGVVLLPLDGDPERPKIKSIIINDTSNGTPGNNHQEGVYGHKSIETVGDNKPNTWFEYEIVSTREIKNPLVLDLTFVLDEVSVINHINIHPIFFGTSSPLEIQTIETSKDGEEYLSIKDEIPIKDFVSQEEEDIFSVSPASSNYSGLAGFSFLARKAKFIHIVFKQSSSYPIETINGPRLRYAIGLRDINILSRKFKSTGSLVSNPFSTSTEVKKVSMWASENPSQASSLADLTHYVSHDNGGSWASIQPQERTGNLIPEVINYNTIATKSINTEEEVLSLRHKIAMARIPDSFKGDYVVKEEEIQTLDVVNIPNPTNPEVTLKEKPIPQSVTAIIPYLGSFSCPRARYGSDVLDESAPMDLDFVEFRVDSPGTITTTDDNSQSQEEGILVYKLPYKNIPDLSEKIRVFVNGTQIEYRPKDDYLFDNPSLFPPMDNTISYTSRVYFLNKGGTELQFGYKQDKGGYVRQRGFVPAAGSKIEVCLDGDNPSLELTEDGYKLNLLTASDGNKETINIITLKTLEEESAAQYEVEVPVGVSSYQLPIMKENSIGELLTREGEESKDSFKIPLFLEGASYIEIKEFDGDGNLITGSNRRYYTPVDYINGRSELENIFGDSYVNQYSFDAATGTLHLGGKTLDDRKVIFVCYKIEAERISPDYWDFDINESTGAINPQNIILEPSQVYTTKQVKTYTKTSSHKTIQLIENNTNSHNWYNQRLVKGTVKPALSLFANNVSPVEVNYIDGTTEFSNITEVEKEPIVFTETSAGSGIYSFTLSKTDTIHELLGTPVFAPVRSIDSATTPTNIFTGGEVSSTATKTTGQWSRSVDSTTGIMTIYVAASSTPGSHTVSYKVNNLDTGVDHNGLYSVDYYHGVIYFSSPIAGSGNIDYEVSLYSAFYNIGEVLSSSKIEQINTEEKTIKFNHSFAMKFIKQDKISDSRPQVLKILYNYDKTIKESLADLEPYFSPICKHIGIRAVTSDVLEEL